MINGKLNVPDFAAIPPLLEELKNFKSQENLLEHVKPLQMSVYYIQYISYYTQVNEIEKAYSILDESIAWFEKNDHLVSEYFKIIFYDSVFLVYFIKGEYKNAFLG